MLPQELVRRKRDGGVLAPDDIAAFITGLTDGRVTEGQAATFAMAVLFRGMTAAETVALTLAMRDSGVVLDWRALGEHRPVVDKHSTGGIGDKVSLILAPLLAACGAAVPMISGRGLGHTGGTLDKLDAIPGYCSQPSRERFVAAVRDTGCAIVGATDDLAPADRRLYAIRDVTATVDSVPLIVASILSKKLAEGTQSLVMDVKIGSGAFMTQEADARELATTLVRVASGAGVPTVALLTDMDQALGRSVGNALEVREAIDFLVGTVRDSRLETVTLALAAEALVLCGLYPDLPRAEACARKFLADGSAAQTFARSVAALGGPSDLLEHPARHFPLAPVRVAVAAERSGVVSRIDGRALGVAVVALGGGRTRPQDGIDHRVCMASVAGLGELVEAGDPLCIVHAATQDAAAAAATAIRAAMVIGDAAVLPPPPIRGRIGGGSG
jgi:thymidine phosphorylase